LKNYLTREAIISVVNFTQIAAIDKTDLTEQAAMLPKPMLEKVSSCLKLVLEIN